MEGTRKKLTVCLFFYIGASDSDFPLERMAFGFLGSWFEFGAGG